MKELEDYNWFPSKLRQFQSEFIGYVVYKFALYKPIIPIVDNVIAIQKITQIVDLCSGSGLPSLYISKNLKMPISILLTDKFLASEKVKTVLPYQTSPIDALTISFEKNTLYTMFNAFHHFNKEEQKLIITNAKTAKATLLIVEILTPNVFTFLQVIFTSTIGQLLLTPFIKPFGWLRLLFTYIIPINMVTVLIDGIISVTKSKTKEQYHNLLKDMETKEYTIETNSIFRLGNKLILITAQPTI
jgi:hypothetical protein